MGGILSLAKGELPDGIDERLERLEVTMSAIRAAAERSASATERTARALEKLVAQGKRP